MDLVQCPLQICLPNLKSKNSYSEEAVKEASKSVKSSKQIQKEIDTAYDLEAKIFELMSKKDPNSSQY